MTEPAEWSERRKEIVNSWVKQAELHARIIDIAIHLYAVEVAKPVGFNDTQPDWEAIAKACVTKARETAPYLLAALEEA